MPRRLLHRIRHNHAPHQRAQLRRGASVVSCICSGPVQHPGEPELLNEHKVRSVPHLNTRTQLTFFLGPAMASRSLIIVSKEIHLHQRSSPIKLSSLHQPLAMCAPQYGQRRRWPVQTGKQLLNSVPQVRSAGQDVYNSGSRRMENSTLRSQASTPSVNSRDSPSSLTH